MAGRADPADHPQVAPALGPKFVGDPPREGQDLQRTGVVADTTHALNLAQKPPPHRVTVSVPVAEPVITLRWCKLSE
jgi:hypothetical protein